MIRLQRAASDQGFRALLQCLSDQEFEFARFVPAEGQPRLVVTFDKDPWTI
jgi:hypothetical protein